MARLKYRNHFSASLPFNYKKYPPNWMSEIRPRILARDNHTCQNCGLGANDSYQRSSTKIRLTVAHLDHDAGNWQVIDERLLTLCASCHFRYDNGHKFSNPALSATSLPKPFKLNRSRYR